MGRKVHATRCKNARVFYRIFPMVKMHWEHVKILEDMKTLYIRYLQDFEVGREHCVPSYWKFETDGLFYNNTQDEIYESVMAGVLDNVIEGSNAVIVAYGQTGSGKSLTINGLLNSYQDRGIAPRVISDLFQKKESLKSQCKMCIQMSYIETKNQYVTDLLSSDLPRVQDVRNVKVVKIKDESIAMKTLFKVEGRRQFSKDFSNSHAANGVLTLHIVSKPLNQTEALKKIGKIHIVDLAGVDTFGNITSLHKDIFELGSANLAKSQLELFVLILCQNIPERVLANQRVNVLVKYLSDSLTAHSLLRFVGHLRTDKENLFITISMLRFGQIIRGLMPQKLQPNVSEDVEIKYLALQQELLELQRENDLNIMLSNSDLSANITQERIKHMQHVAEDYLQEKTNDIVLLNVTDANTVLRVFKDLYNKLQLEKEACVRDAYDKACEDLKAGGFPGSKADITSSVKSSRKGSRRSIKSKDHPSIVTVGSTSRLLAKGPKKTAGPVVPRSESPAKSADSRRKSAPSLLKLKSQDRQSQKSLRRSKASSFSITKRSSTSRRKSNCSAGLHGTPGKGSIPEEVPLPETVPSHEEAWHLYINDSVYDYSKLMDVSHECEGKAKEVHRNYLDEVHGLQKFTEVVDIRKNELQKAQMQRLLEKEERDEEGNVIISYLERICLENLKKARDDLVEHQEKILKAQTELKLALEDCRNARKAIGDQYEVYCREKFQTSVPDLDSMSIKAMEESVVLTGSQDEGLRNSTATLVKQSDICYKSLKHVMMEQMQKNIRKREKSRKWIQSCKA